MKSGAPKPENHLYYGDNLTRMQQMAKHSVDLIYLDPPFNSKQNYNLIYKNMTGKPVSDQADAFCDTWEMDAEKEELAKAMPVLMREMGVEDYYVQFWRLWINALRHTQPHLLAYLIYMVQRLLHMKSILRPTGSIYLHCDPTASHYIKVMMDGIFGHNNFQNEIIWKRTSAHNSAKRWGPVHDVLLFYTASDNYIWNKVYQAYDEGYTDAFYRHKGDDGRLFRIGDLTGAGTRHGESGTVWRDVDPTAKGRHWAPPRKFPGGELFQRELLRRSIISIALGESIGPKNLAFPASSVIWKIWRASRFKTLSKTSLRFPHTGKSALDTRRKSLSPF